MLRENIFLRKVETFLFLYQLYNLQCGVVALLFKIYDLFSISRFIIVAPKKKREKNTYHFLILYDRLDTLKLL